MAIEIPNGAVASVIFKANISSAPFGATADSIITSIGQELIGDGLTIAQSDVGFSGVFFALTGEFSATLQILNQSGQELDDTDLIAQLTDAVAAVGGSIVSAGVAQVVGTGGGQNSHTGSQGNVTPVGTATGNAPKAGSSAHACGDPSWSFFDDPAQWLSCLTSKGLSTVGLLAIGLIIGIILIVGIERRPTPV